jgi:hypothetical protein
MTAEVVIDSIVMIVMVAIATEIATEIAGHEKNANQF